MRRALCWKNKFDFIDGAIPISVEFDPSYNAWNFRNMLVHSWIMNLVEEPIAQSLHLLWLKWTYHLIHAIERMDFLITLVSAL